MRMPYKYIQDWTMIGLFLFSPLIIGYWAGRNEIIRKPKVVTVDIVNDGNEILVYEHYSRKLFFEYNKNKKAENKAYK